jgi:hypothetical protein
MNLDSVSPPVSARLHAGQCRGGIIQEVGRWRTNLSEYRQSRLVKDNGEKSTGCITRDQRNDCAQFYSRATGLFGRQPRRRDHFLLTGKPELMPKVSKPAEIDL